MASEELIFFNALKVFLSIGFMLAAGFCACFCPVENNRKGAFWRNFSNRHFILHLSWAAYFMVASYIHIFFIKTPGGSSLLAALALIFVPLWLSYLAGARNGKIVGGVVIAGFTRDLRV